MALKVVLLVPRKNSFNVVISLHIQISDFGCFFWNLLFGTPLEYKVLICKKRLVQSSNLSCWRCSWHFMYKECSWCLWHLSIKHTPNSRSNSGAHTKKQRSRVTGGRRAKNRSKACKPWQMECYDHPPSWWVLTPDPQWFLLGGKDL